jgi:hypothetical protein
LPADFAHETFGGRSATLESPGAPPDQSMREAAKFRK